MFVCKNYFKQSMSEIILPIHNQIKTAGFLMPIGTLKSSDIKLDIFKLLKVIT